MSLTDAKAFADSCDSFSMQLPLENTKKADMDVSAEINNVFNGYSVMGFISLFATLARGEILVPPYT